MNTQQLLIRIEQLFVQKLQEKTGWGRNEIIVMYRDAQREAMMEMLS